MLYFFVTPEEMIAEFGNKRLPAVSTIYSIIKKANFDKRKAKEEIRNNILYACPEDMTIQEWAELVDTNMPQTKALLFARIWKRIDRDEAKDFE